jgi:hypothetical protein
MFSGHPKGHIVTSWLDGISLVRFGVFGGLFRTVDIKRNFSHSPPFGRLSRSFNHSDSFDDETKYFLLLNLYGQHNLI